MTQPVRAIPVGEITSGTDLFHCEPYNCKLTARSCVDRRERNRQGVDLNSFRSCGDCDQGAEVERRSGVRVELKIYRPSHGVPRVAGTSAHGGVYKKRRDPDGPTARIIALCTGQDRSRAELVAAGLKKSQVDTLLHLLFKRGTITRSGEARAYRYRAK